MPVSDAPDIVLTCRLTCPHCSAVSEQPMPRDACIVFHECADCGQLVRPKSGDCCVFCSWGDTPCPPIQAGEGCCQ